MALDPALYLLPVGISDAPVDTVIPPRNLEVASQIRHFIVENVRTARRWLRRCDPAYPIEECEFYELNRHTRPEDVSGFLAPLRRGVPVGVMSEAGCPAVADPGADVVAIAQREGMKVVPLVGPSSILMSLMGSGFNGQGFAFHGYLPVEPSLKASALRELENESSRRDMTQIFIETPYRNDKTVALMASTLRPDTMMCVACDITDPLRQEIVSLPASKWRGRAGSFDKRPAIFLIYRRPMRPVKTSDRKK
ncbi:MAG: SAM-dependent methyltransferase [Muribaculaceae bacterium]|nr:SAM-dependent methyltransferase [Muribaculaceae bacterium]